MSSMLKNILKRLMGIIALDAYEEYFKKSLAVDGNYTFSIIGLIEACVFRRKFLKAVYLFSKNRQKSSFYSKSGFFRTEAKDFLSQLSLKNIVLKLILYYSTFQDMYLLGRT